jgi:hypothetical protein
MDLLWNGNEREEETTTAITDYDRSERTGDCELFSTIWVA